MSSADSLFSQLAIPKNTHQIHHLFKLKLVLTTPTNYASFKVCSVTTVSLFPPPDPVWVIVRVQDDASILGLANQLSNITTQETDMESEETCTDKTRHDQDVAPSMSTSCQEHTFGSGSMMTSPNSIPTGVCLERLLQNHPPSPTDSGREELACQGRQENTPLHLDSVRASADSSSHPSSIPMHSVSNQNQTLEWNSGLAQQQQHGALSPAPPGMISTVASMEETPNADLNPT